MPGDYISMVRGQAPSVAGAVDLRFDASQRMLSWTNTEPTTIPAYGCFEVVEYSLTSAGRVKISGKLFDDIAQPCGINHNHDVAEDKHGQCTFDSPTIVLVSGTPAVGDGIGPTAGSYQMSSGGTGFIVLGAPVSGKVLVMRAGGGAATGLVVFYGTMNEDYTAGPTDMDVTIDRVIGLNDIPDAADVSWNNDHAKLVDIGDEVTGTGYLDDFGIWQVRIIEYDEEFFMCSDDAMVVDGGDLDDLYPYGSAPGNAYPYGAD